MNSRHAPTIFSDNRRRQCCAVAVMRTRKGSSVTSSAELRLHFLDAHRSPCRNVFSRLPDLVRRPWLGQDVKRFFQRFQILGREKYRHGPPVPRHSDALMSSFHLSDQLGEVISCIAHWHRAHEHDNTPDFTPDLGYRPQVGTCPAAEQDHAYRRAGARGLGEMSLVPRSPHPLALPQSVNSTVATLHVSPTSFSSSSRTVATIIGDRLRWGGDEVTAESVAPHVSSVVYGIVDGGDHGSDLH